MSQMLMYFQIVYEHNPGEVGSRACISKLVHVLQTALQLQLYKILKSIQFVVFENNSYL